MENEVSEQVDLHIAIEAVATFCSGDKNSASNDLKRQIHLVMMAYLESKEREEKLTHILIESAARGIELRTMTPNLNSPTPPDA